MSEEALRELLRSPLDDLPPRRRAPLILVAVVLLAGAVGAAGAWGASRVLDREEETAGSTTAPSTTTTIPAALDGEYRWEVVAAFSQGDASYVVAATIAEPEAAPEDVPWTALWALRYEGSDPVDFAAEYLWPEAPGTFTARFDVPGLEGARALAIHPVAGRDGSSTTLRLDEGSLPWTGPAGEVIEVRGARVAIDSITIDDGGGWIEWHLEGDPSLRAWVWAEVTYTEAGQAQESWSAGFLPGGERSDPPPSAPTRGGGVEIYHDTGTVSGGDPQRVVEVSDLRLTVTAVVYWFADEAVVVDLPVPAGE